MNAARCRDGCLHSGLRRHPKVGVRHEQIDYVVESHLLEDLDFFRLHQAESADRVEHIGCKCLDGGNYVCWPIMVAPRVLVRVDCEADIVDTARYLAPLAEVMSGNESTLTGPVGLNLLPQLELFAARAVVTLMNATVDGRSSAAHWRTTVLDLFDPRRGPAPPVQGGSCLHGTQVRTWCAVGTSSQYGRS